MIEWQKFFDVFKDKENIPVPGVVMVVFENRYLELMADIKYKIVCDGKEKCGVTGNGIFSVILEPKGDAEQSLFLTAHRIFASSDFFESRFFELLGHQIVF